MRTAIAVVFPVLAVLAAWALARPGEVLRQPPGPPRAADRTLLPRITAVLWRLNHVAVSAPFVALLTWAQHRLLLEATAETGWTFSWRPTDHWVYALIPGAFAGMLAGYPFCVRVLRAFLGTRLVDLADRPGIDRVGTSLRQELAMMPSVSAWLALFAVVLNAAAVDTFFQVGNGRFRYSGFFSPRTSELSAADIGALLEVHAKRIGLNGRRTNETFLVLRMKEGEAIDTYGLLFQSQIPYVIAALRHEAGGTLPVSRCRGARSR